MTDTLGFDLASIARLEARTPLCDRCSGRHQPAGLDACMASVLARMQTLSYGKSASYNSSGGGKSEHVRPQGDAHPMHEHWAQEWDRAIDEDRRDHVFRSAKDALDNELKQRTQIEVGDLEQARLDRIAEATEGWRDQDVATAHALTLPQVHRMRTKRQRDPLTGDPVDEDTKSQPATPEAIEKARRLRGMGMSYRQIQMSTGVPKSVLQRHLKAA